MIATLTVGSASLTLTSLIVTVGSPSSSRIVIVLLGSEIVAPPVAFEIANSKVSGPSLETSSTTVMVNG